MSTELPYEIKYLIPVIEELEKFAPDELGDDNQGEIKGYGVK